jgi:hypothetical protein
MKDKIYFSICVLIISLLVISCSIKDEKIIGVKMYELKESVPILIENWNELNINTAFVSQQVINNKDFRQKAKDSNIDLFVIFPIFYNPEAISKDPSIQAITNKGQVAKEDWVEFVCPTRKEYHDQIIAKAKEIVRKTQPEGISIDFIRHFAYWEMIRPEFTPDSIPESCFCDHCLKTFISETGSILPLDLINTEAQAEWIRNNLRIEWTTWKSNQITSLVKRFTNELKEESPNLKFNLHAVPWRKEDYNGAGMHIVGQNLYDLSKMVDYISPMCYTFMLYRSPEWINSLVKDFNEQGLVNIIPSIQVKECYRQERFTVDEFKLCIDEALKEPSKGIVFWSWDYIEQEPEKRKVIKEVLSKQ